MRYRDLTDSAKANARYNVKRTKEYAEAIAPGMIDGVYLANQRVNSTELPFLDSMWRIDDSDWGVGFAELVFKHKYLDDRVTVTVTENKALYALDVHGKTYEELTSNEWKAMLASFREVAQAVLEMQNWYGHEWEAYFNSRGIEFDEVGAICS